MTCTWDGRCMTCGTKITTGGCSNASCSDNPFGVKIIRPTIVSVPVVIKPVVVGPFPSIMPDGFTTTTGLGA